MKKTCLAWFAVYVLAALFVGHLIFRRYPVWPAVVFGGAFGGFVVWIGLAYLGGVRTKLVEARRLRATMEGGPPRDGETIAVLGTMEAAGPLLASPLTGRPCVAYKYAIRRRDKLLYDGFALTPSVVSSQHGQLRILGYPALEVKPRVIPEAEAVPNFSAYREKTPFAEPDVRDIRTAFGEALNAFDSEKGSVRTDTRMTGDDAPLDGAVFTEWSFAPGDPVFATGRYSMEKSALVPEPGTPISVILRDGVRGAAGRSVAGALGNLFGGLFFLLLAALGILALDVFVPLDAKRPTWREVRLERWIERNIRTKLALAPTRPARSTYGRVNDVTVSRATASRLGDMTVIRIDDGVLTLTLDAQDRPLRLRFGDMDVNVRDLDLVITDDSSSEISGRLIYFRDDAETPACWVTFHAPR